MLQRYKLRLGDGTVLMVDHEGLSTWLMDGKAMVQGGRVKHWHPLKEFLAEERVLAKYAARKQAKALAELPTPLPVPSAPPEMPVVDPPPTEDAAAALAIEPPETAAATDPVFEPPPPPVSMDEPPVLAVEPSAPEPAAIAEPAAMPEPAAMQAPLDRQEIEPPPEPPSDAEPPVWAVDPSPSGPFERASIGEPASLLVLADDPANRPAEPTPPTAYEEPTPYEDLSIIPLKPLDDAPPPPTHFPARTSEREGSSLFEDASLFEEPSFLEKTTRPTKEPRRLNLDGPLEWLGAGCEAVLALWSDLVARLVRRLAATRHRAQSMSLASVWAPDAAPEPPAVQPAVQDAAPPRKPAKPPPTLGELAVVPLAEFDEPNNVEDVYEDEGERWPSVAWRWARRGIAAAILLAAGILAGATWETWFPKAIELGPMLFSELDRRTGTSARAETQRQALEQAALQLPHLDQETIRRLMSGKPTGVLEPAEAFRLASDAAARGAAALSPDEAQELDTLRRRLLDGLGPFQRDRIREYERLRSQRATYPFEDRAAMELLASGARALDPQTRARLQALSSRAVGAGLALSRPPASSDAAPR